MNNDKTMKTLAAYHSLVRYKYSDLEKLSRLKILNDYYNSISSEVTCSEKHVSSVEVAESLSKEFILPLKVRGVFLTEGRPKKKFYSRYELEKSVFNPINSSFALMLDHRDKEAGMIIGKVDKIEYDSSIKGLRWWGHINSEVHARNVLDGVIKEVSVTVYSQSVNDKVNGLCGVDLTFKELSLCIDGAEPNNSIFLDGEPEWK